MNNEIRKSILELLGNSSQAWAPDDIAFDLETPIEECAEICDTLCGEALLVKTKKGRYASPQSLGLVGASASAQRNGTPTALPLDGSAVMRLTSRGKERTLPGDRILVRPDRRGECDLVSIVSRGMTELAAYLRVSGKKMTAAPCDRRIACAVNVTGETLGAANNAIVMLSIDRYPDEAHPMKAHIIRVFGDRSEVNARLEAIAASHGFDREYPDVGSFDIENAVGSDGREDLRGLVTFTIDGPFSKDFDDAVSLTLLPDGSAELGVHIADVSHFVTKGSALDKDALRRGTSLYLPGVTVPMLPEILSNDLCSLMPDADRLTLSVFMRIEDGKQTESRICKGVIRSRARLTYDQVNRYFDGETDAVPQITAPVLDRMIEVSRAIRKRREDAGCIELDLPETEFVLDAENRPSDIYAAVRGESERMIEDFMLAANEAVAAFAKHTSAPIVYRVHEHPDPDRLHDLEELLRMTDIKVRLGKDPHPKRLAKILEDTADHPAAEIIKRTLLRCMQRARYDEMPLGHYALSMPDYCHFTSPIRRYPDLITHRVIKQMLDGQIGETPARIAMIADQSSNREQEATLAEREADDLMKALYMRDRIGAVCEGIVSSVKSWGLYVLLDNTVEGLVHITTMDDYYIYNERTQTLTGESTGTVFRMGDRVRVRITEADIDRMEVGFALLPWEQKE